MKIKKNRMLARRGRGLFNMTNNVKLLVGHKDDLMDDNLEDHRVFELFLMYLVVRHRFDLFTYRKILDKVRLIDQDLTVKKLLKFPEDEREKLVHSGFKIINSAIKVNAKEMSTRDLDTFEMLLEILEEVAEDE